ncbi:MAG TPA: hypothetical protein VFU05_18810, partial [Cyclobacteriaceae bacterium]|nr:hypothetical protein [Cyclobacteriaceae bacterium]
MRNKVKVLVVGQTPPPFLGQAMMIDRLVKGKFENVSIFHVRMAFSDNLQAIGKFKFKKLTHLLYVVLKTIQMRFKHNVSILYYPPSGPHRVPLMRDLMILFCIRPFFKKTIFHYRAAGVSQLLERSTPVIRFLGKKIYNHPHGAIQQSILNPADGKYFHARKTFIIKNGLEDAAAKYLPLERHPSATLKILFVGAMYKERGILVLLEAAKLLKESGIPFRAVCVGDFATPAFGVEAKEQCRAYGLREQFLFPGSKIGDAKWHEYLT